jgi:hypothetical protein
MTIRLGGCRLAAQHLLQQNLTWCCDEQVVARPMYLAARQSRCKSMSPKLVPGLLIRQCDKVTLAAAATQHFFLHFACKKQTIAGLLVTMCECLLVPSWKTLLCPLNIYPCPKGHQSHFTCGCPSASTRPGWNLCGLHHWMLVSHWRWVCRPS